MNAESTSGRRDLSDWLARLLESWGAGAADLLRPLLEAQLEPFDASERQRFLERVETTGGTWGYHPPDPIARAISRAVLGEALEPGSGIENPAALEVARSRPVVFLGNHLSFVDVNALDCLLAESGYADVAERITALVGPKVFAAPLRSLASLCFGTIKLPQSTSRASGEAIMTPRQVARVASRTIRTARARQRKGEHVLVFPEGSRSRSGAMQRCLPAVARYLEAPRAVLIPWGHTGCERLMPLEEDRVRPARVRVRIGPALEAARVLDRCEGRRPLVMDVVGFLIAAELPAAYRGAYAGSPEALHEAREIANELAG